MINSTPRKQRRSNDELIADADARGSAILADANEAAEAGFKAKAERLYTRAQKWLDRSNNLRGCGPA